MSKHFLVSVSPVPPMKLGCNNSDIMQICKRLWILAYSGSPECKSKYALFSGIFLVKIHLLNVLNDQCHMKRTFLTTNTWIITYILYFEHRILENPTIRFLQWLHGWHHLILIWSDECHVICHMVSIYIIAIIHTLLTYINIHILYSL